MATTAKKAAPAKTAAKTTASKSTAVAVQKPSGGAVVSVQEMMAAQLAALQGKTAPVGGNMIRVTQDKQFILPDGSKTPGPLQLVIVDFNSRNTFYEGAFDKNNISPPACFAIGDIPLKLIPSENSPVKQADSCAECPMNAFGSAGTGKACKNSRMLAVLPPDADEDTPMWTLAVSPTAIKGFDGFVKNVQRMFSVPPVGVVAEVSFDENETYARLKFGDAEPNGNAAVHLSRLEEAKELLAVEPDVSSFGQQPAKKVAAPARRPAVARR